jgi:Domain of Unknown Function (DUF1080)
MKFLVLLYLATTLAPADECNLFNGKDLTGWRGDPSFWSVEDGIITGRTTLEMPASANTFLIWKGEVADFTLTLKYKMQPGDDQRFVNSGIQFRSKVVDEKTFVVAGYQADLEYGETYSGILYEEKGRGVLAQRGEKVTLTQGENPLKPKIEVTGETGKSAEIQAAIKKDDWNEYRLVVRGNQIQQFINGKATAEVTDATAEAAKKGVLALQLHVGPPMQIQFKDILYTEL